MVIYFNRRSYFGPQLELLKLEHIHLSNKNLFISSPVVCLVPNKSFFIKTPTMDKVFYELV